MRHTMRAGAAGALLLALLATACAGEDSGDEVTVYSADGLKYQSGDGFYDRAFKQFEEETGVKVNYVEGGSGEVVQRLTRERNNTKADVLITLPPFIQQAQSRGLLDAYRPAGWENIADPDKDADGMWTAVVKNYFCFIYNTEELDSPPETWQDLLDSSYKGRFQYSTPGVAGDGTAVVIKSMHDFGGLEPAMEYLEKLQVNNVGPSASTGALVPKVDKGELLVSNSDVQMSFANREAMPNQDIFFPAMEGKAPTTFSLPYAGGLVKGGPQQENAQKLLDYLVSPEAQELISDAGGGFPSRTDVTPQGEYAERARKALDGVEIFTPDWRTIDKELDSYLEAWREATGS
ncbi:2-aminoethylphosphonate ABC transporter substrate-binding protein [Streptomyces sp. GSL17-111]|uniref:2-aminoethylphosphonate ABC transporter substrate-binding protein n=1 Tax=Streptomyces sp. GSL17-111 TaxID=3121596 RepID=UPI0030F3F2BA